MIYIFDKDETLTSTFSSNVCPKNHSDFFLLPNVFETIQDLVYQKHKIMLITNQGGVSCQMMKEVDFWRVIHVLEFLLNILFNDVKVSFFYENAKNSKFYVDKRKPLTLMFEHLVNDCSDVNEKKIYVGDGFSDQKFAENCGLDFVYAHDFFGWKPEWIEKNHFGYNIKKDIKSKLRNVALGGNRKLYRVDYSRI